MAQAQFLLPSVAAFSGTRLLHSSHCFRSHRMHMTRSLSRFNNARRYLLSAHSQEHDARRASTSKLSVDDEYSEIANEELLLFLFQLDLATRLQRALNQDHYDVAQVIREKINEVEQEVAKRRDMKSGSAAAAKEEAQDKELGLLRLKSELATAIEKEDYAGAGRLKDQISKANAEALAASAKALIYQNVNYAFRLGQKIKHKVHGYRGVVCGMDPVCCESNEWIKSARVDELPRGRHQPFYQILVDERRDDAESLVTYVAEDSLEEPSEPDLEALSHPYIFFLFYGMDATGDYIPAKQLRAKYDAPRHEARDDREAE